MSMGDAWKTLLRVPPRGASFDIQEEEPHEKGDLCHLLRHRGGVNGVDSMASSHQIDTREHPGRDLWDKGFPDNSKMPFAL